MNEDLLFKAGLDAANFNTGIEGMIKNVGKMALAGLSVGAVVGLFKNMGEEALKDEKATYALASAVKGLKGATEDQFVAMTSWAQKTSEMTGENLPEMKRQLTELVRLTGDTTIAEKSYMTALDISKTGIMDMDTAVKMVSKAVNGHTEAFARYGIELDKTSSKQDILNALTKKFGGAEDSYLETTAGKLQKAQNSFNLLENEIGQNFLPVLGWAAQALANFLAQFTTQGRVVGEMQDHIKLLSKELDEWTQKLNAAEKAGNNKDMLEAYNRIKGIQTELAKAQKDLASSGGVFGTDPKEMKKIYEAAKAGVGENEGQPGATAGEAEEKANPEELWDKMREEQIKDEENFNETMADLEKQRNQANLDSTTGTLSKIRELHVGHSKALFEITKGAGIAEIGINTAQAIMKTLAEGGMFAIPESIAIGAVGAQQMAVAASTAFNPAGAATGLFDWRAPGNTEHLVTTIGAGESILSGPQTQALKQGMKGGGGALEFHAHIHTDALTDASGIMKNQILPEFKKFIVQERGGQLAMPDGTPNF